MSKHPTRLTSAVRLRTQPRLMLGEHIAMGPGKADLLEAIITCGSISAAGKQLGMSYRRAWQLVDTMNQCFTSPLVETAKGGAQGGGAHVTELGKLLLNDYRQLQRELNQITHSYSGRFSKYLADTPDLN